MHLAEICFLFLYLGTNVEVGLLGGRLLDLKSPKHSEDLHNLDPLD